MNGIKGLKVLSLAQKVPNDPFVAWCCYSHKSFSIGGQGIGQVFFSHEKS